MVSQIESVKTHNWFKWRYLKAQGKASCHRDRMEMWYCLKTAHFQNLRWLSRWLLFHVHTAGQSCEVGVNVRSSVTEMVGPTQSLFEVREVWGIGVSEAIQRCNKQFRQSIKHVLAGVQTENSTALKEMAEPMLTGAFSLWWDYEIWDRKTGLNDGLKDNQMLNTAQRFIMIWARILSKSQWLGLRDNYFFFWRHNCEANSRNRQFTLHINLSRVCLCTHLIS